tara:strand:+ start:85 stop:666 length:582 start_codon:yes stop_codon:yes gene_type:complete
LAGRPNKRLEAAKEQLKENILNCNEAGLYSACNKIPKSSWNKITNEQFVKSKKLDARRVLDKCIVDKDLWHCYKISGDYYTKKDRSQLDWIKDDMTSEEYDLIENLTKRYKIDRDRRLENYKKEEKKKEKSPTLKKIEIIRLCEDLIKANLKDPNSYKRITSRYMQIETGLIEYTATNSFGGRVRKSFRCYNP